MIENVNDKVVDITSGNSNIEVTYNTDVLKQGSGIKLDKRTPNRIKVVNTNQTYNISNDSITNVFTNNVIKLSEYDNYVRHENGGSTIALIRDLDIFIDDRENAWKKGQTLKLVINDPIDLDIYDIKIKTDPLNRANNGEYGTVVGVLNDLDFSGSGNTPIFEIVCVNSDILDFRIDKIR
jgi:hypothetical protein